MSNHIQCHRAIPAFLLAVSFFGIPARAAEIPSGGRTDRLLAIAPGTNAVNRIIVMLPKGVDVDQFAEDHDIKPNRVWRHAYNGFVADLDDATAQRLKGDSRVVQVMPDSFGGRHGSQIIPTGVARIGVEHFPPVKIDGTDKRVNVDVAVIDTGIQADHPDLNVVQSVSVSGPELVDPFVFGADHGTACAGIIGALDNDFGVVGAAPGVRLWSIRASNLASFNAEYSDSALYSAFDYVAQHADQIAVASCSFYGSSDYVNADFRYWTEQGILAGVNKGVVYVACAGNQAADIAGHDDVPHTGDDVVPAALPQVMAVSGVTAATDRFANYSNFSRSRHSPSYVNSPGGAIDVAGPTDSIATTTLGGYRYDFNGTSAACPHAAGVVALYIATHGRATNAAGVYAIRQAIIDASLPQSQWQTINAFDRDPNHEGMVMPSLAWTTNAPELRNIVKAASGIEVKFSTVTGYVHTLQAVEALHTNSVWADIAITNGTGAEAVVNDGAMTDSRFYRLSTTTISPPPNIHRLSTNVGSLGASAHGVYESPGNLGFGGALVGEPTNSAIRCAGIQMQVGQQPALNVSGPFSVELWVKPGQTAAEQLTVGSHYSFGPNGVSSYREGWLIYQGLPGNTSGNGFFFRCCNSNSPAAVTDAILSTPLDVNSWYHVVGVYDGATVMLYVNGALAAATSIPAPFRPNVTDPMTFGQRSDGAFPFDGFLDEAAYYPHALTAAQVLTHYEAGTNAAPSIPYSQVSLDDNPAGYWRFDER